MFLFSVKISYIFPIFWIYKFLFSYFLNVPCNLTPCICYVLIYLRINTFHINLFSNKYLYIERHIVSAVSEIFAVVNDIFTYIYFGWPSFFYVNVLAPSWIPLWSLFYFLLQFSNIQVSRRYKHFDWLHDRLVEKFTVIAVPPLPDKQIAGKCLLVNIGT